MRRRSFFGIAWVCALLQWAVPAAGQAVPGFGTYVYDPSGNIVQAGADTFFYDVHGRLKSANVGTTSQTYTFDRYGNLETMTTDRDRMSTTNPVLADTFTVDAESNQLLTATKAGGSAFALTYDGSGNVIEEGANRYVYDGLGNLTESTIEGKRTLYLYTASGERIASTRVYPGGGRGTDWTIRDPEGRVLRKLAKSPDGTWRWVEDYVYGGGKLLAAEVNAPEKVLHFHTDHLGTPRLITGNGGARVGQHTYDPFGVEHPATVTPQDVEAMKFTGHERDDTSVDYMHARYYAGYMGRFLSVDPVLSVKRAMRHPQAWNRYSYANNNPLKYVDPNGALFQLTGCVQDAKSKACGAQMALVRHSFGKNWQDAMKHLKLGSNGMLTLKGISAAAFGQKFGNVGQALGMLISSKDTFKLHTIFTGTGGGAATSVDMREMNVSPGHFPRDVGGVKGMGATEAFVHELGHMVSSLFPGYADALNAKSALSGTTRGVPRREAYATNFESQWRVDILGAEPRPAYTEFNDYIYLGHAPLFPPEP